jgi:HEAT repeats
MIRFILKQYLHPMVTALKHNDNDMYWKHVDYLGTLTPENAEIAVPALIGMLRDRDDDVRKAVCEVLGAIGIAAKAAIPQLFDALLDVDPSVRDAAARAYGKIGVAAVPPLLSWLRFSERAEDALVEIGPVAIPALIEAFHVPQRDYRERLARILGGIGPAAIPALIVGLRNRDNLVCEAAGDALRLIGAPSISALVEIMRTDDVETRLKAETVLKTIDETAAAAVIQLLKDEEEAAAALRERQGQAGSELEGIEVMGDEAVLQLKPLDTFRQIGQICRQRGNDTFTFTEMVRQLGLPDSTIQEHINSIGELFRKYFKKFEFRIDIPLDTEKKAAKEHKLFDRGKGKHGSTICHPLGWRAWALACQFLERRESAETAMRRAKRQNS